uniref:Ycf34 n=1 Tax=Callithamnion tetricum TaxID=193179 RepID=A0A4D6WNI1_9FLOR|nr:hypothetical protein [Callithamnion tetricum]
MCICVNCRHIYQCNTYLFIQKQHKKKIVQSLKKYNFTPQDTIIKINIIKNVDQMKFDWDLIECLSFIEQPGKWLDS